MAAVASHQAGPVLVEDYVLDGDSDDESSCSSKASSVARTKEKAVVVFKLPQPSSQNIKFIKAVTVVQSANRFNHLREAVMPTTQEGMWTRNLRVMGFFTGLAKWYLSSSTSIVTFCQEVAPVAISVGALYYAWRSFIQDEMVLFNRSNAKLTMIGVGIALNSIYTQNLVLRFLSSIGSLNYYPNLAACFSCGAAINRFVFDITKWCFAKPKEVEAPS